MGIKWAIKTYIRWKNPDPVLVFASTLIKFGVILMVPKGLGFFVALSFPDLLASMDLEFGSQLSTIAFIMGVILCIAALLLGGYRAINFKRTSKTIIIMYKGMRGMNFVSPEKDLPAKLTMGQIEYINIPDQSRDVSDQFTDVEEIPKQIRQRLTQSNHNHVNMLYCGLAPIPLLFYSGYQLQEREKIEVMEYDRSAQSWVFLDGKDDMEIIQISEPESTITATELAVTISFSFPVNRELARDKLALNSQIISFDLENGPRLDALGSMEKQNRVIKLIVERLAKIRSDYPQITKFHLFMSSQASFAVNFGKSWTTTVLPSIEIYNFDSEKNAYTWSISISHRSADLHQ